MWTEICENHFTLKKTHHVSPQHQATSKWTVLLPSNYTCASTLKINSTPASYILISLSYRITSHVHFAQKALTWKMNITTLKKPLFFFFFSFNTIITWKELLICSITDIDPSYTVCPSSVPYFIHPEMIQTTKLKNFDQLF